MFLSQFYLKDIPTKEIINELETYGYKVDNSFIYPNNMDFDFYIVIDCGYIYKIKAIELYQNVNKYSSFTCFTDKNMFLTFARTDVNYKANIPYSKYACIFVKNANDLKDFVNEFWGNGYYSINTNPLFYEFESDKTFIYVIGNSFEITNKFFNELFSHILTNKNSTLKFIKENAIELKEEKSIDEFRNPYNKALNIKLTNGSKVYDIAQKFFYCIDRTNEDQLLFIMNYAEELELMFNALGLGKLANKMTVEISRIKTQINYLRDCAKNKNMINLKMALKSDFKIIQKLLQQVDLNSKIEVNCAINIINSFIEMYKALSDEISVKYFKELKTYFENRLDIKNDQR